MSGAEKSQKHRCQVLKNQGTLLSV